MHSPGTEQLLRLIRAAVHPFGDRLTSHALIAEDLEGRPALIVWVGHHSERVSFDGPPGAFTAAEVGIIVARAVEGATRASHRGGGSHSSRLARSESPEPPGPGGPA